MGTTNVTVGLNNIVVTSSVTNATTCSSNNGKIQLFRTGGYGPYMYSLDGNTFQASNIFTGLDAGTYNGFVKDSKGCTGMLPGISVGPAGCPLSFASTGKSSTQLVTADEKTLRLLAYPNPSNASFTLSLEGFNSSEKVTVTVTDLLGRIVYQVQGIAKSTYEFGNKFMTGVYNVQVIQGNERKTLKLVKE
jgi:hypothetical protein